MFEAHFKMAAKLVGRIIPITNVHNTSKNICGDSNSIIHNDLISLS